MRLFLISVLLTATTILSGCNDSKPKEPTAEEKAAQQQLDSQQQNSEKYSAYVNAYNRSNRNYAKTLDIFVNTILPDLKKGKTDYFTVADGDYITYYTDDLAKAVSMPGEDKIMDAPAKAFLDALKDFKPLAMEFYSYESTKAYKSDQGKKVIEKAPEYIAKFEKVIAAQNAFNEALDGKDRQIMTDNFNNAKEGTAAKHVAGIALYSREIVDMLGDLYEPDKEAATVTAIEDNLNKINTIYDTWWEYGQKNQCYDLKSGVERFLDRGRTVMENVKKGYYKEQDKSIARPSDDNLGLALNRDLMPAYNNVVNGLNDPRCRY